MGLFLGRTRYRSQYIKLISLFKWLLSPHSCVDVVIIFIFSYVATICGIRLHIALILLVRQYFIIHSLILARSSYVNTVSLLCFSLQWLFSYEIFTFSTLLYFLYLYTSFLIPYISRFYEFLWPKPYVCYPFLEVLAILSGFDLQLCSYNHNFSFLELSRITHWSQDGIENHLMLSF